ncbi:hypothetical protein B0A50_02420 [Salinomyces thailandicus]|uniref:NADPH-dependent FMN reductase-like domain-containing protein n=1 Tax=Salinomyces thailandicus TaxID=706561 RepID=A0A4U0U690_9PEZI|nr:hypothetical protein B0A50_02420 [Salinomyces thailandica]
MTSGVPQPSTSQTQDQNQNERENENENENKEEKPPHPEIKDDRQTALQALLTADAYIIATPTYSHAPASPLKNLLDCIAGPYLDYAFTQQTLSKKAHGDPSFANFTPDPRILKPRVLGFIVTAGSTTPDQYSLALPNLHLLFYCLHVKCVDQFVGRGCLQAGSVLLRPGLVERAGMLGARVASQVGKGYEEAEYLGEREKGACPYCCLRKFELLRFEGEEEGEEGGENSIGCVTCGARGRLVVGEDGEVLPEFEADSEWSCLTLRGKVKHCEDIVRWGREQEGRMEGIRAEVRRWAELEV